MASKAMKSFDDQLAAVRGTIHVVNFAEEHNRMRSGLLYYWNCAEPLHDSAKIIWGAHGPQSIAAMLVGMSIELLLKGIHVAFDKKIPEHHRLHDLCAGVGIGVNQSDLIILQALSEHVIWASRYPNPKTPEQLFHASAIFDKQRRKSGNLANLYIKERELSPENCERLWTLFADRYHTAREARLESVELRY